MVRKKIFLHIIIILVTSLLLSLIISGCSKNKEDIKITTTSDSKVSETTAVETTEIHIEDSTTSTSKAITEGTTYLDFYEGLHITGTPLDVDINTYRLKITGAFDKELSLTFDEVKNMEPVREEIELICPGFFIDKGYWTGVKIFDLLSLAGLNENSKTFKFISIDKTYSQILSLEEIKSEGFLIAYEFNDREFSKYHGYPLRLVAKDKAGSFWVKWLGEIEALAE